MSRFSIPAQACRKKVVLGFDFTFHAANQPGGLPSDRQKLGDGLAMLRDYNSLGAQMIEQGETLFLELGGIHLSHQASL